MSVLSQPLLYASHPWLPTNTFSVPKCVCFPLTLIYWKPCRNVKMLSFFFCLRKYLLWREKTTKWCCIIQKGNNPPPKLRLYTVRQSPTTSQVDASIYFLLSSVSKFRNPICLREKSAVLLVNMYHCTEMQNKAEQMLHVPKSFNAQAHCK